MQEEHAAEVGRLDPPLVAVEELDAGAPLQLLDAAGERRLRQVQVARRVREAAFLGEGPRVPQQPEIEVHKGMLSNP